MSTAHFTKPDLGLPPRPPTAETPLWQHILRPGKEKVPSLQSMPIMAPPLAPLDKNATSMRVLLHDTQANFEKFAKHVGQLLHEVKETHNEMKTTHSLFERDRESLMGDIIDLVNRSQKEVQKSVGTPSQHDVVETLFKDVNHRLGGLDQRLDAIQLFNQTHSQALQTQIQATQILLDKQGSIIAAVVPLLPLLQAIPLHIDAAKSGLSESLTELLSSYKPTVVAVSPLVVDPALPASEPPDYQTGKRKRQQTDRSSISPVQPSETPFKKPRLHTHVRQGSVSMRSNLSTNKTSAESPLEASSSSLNRQSSLHRIKSNTIISPPAANAVTKVPTPLSSGSRRGTFVIPTTPCRPLGDLPISVPAPTYALASVSRQSSTRKSPDLLDHALREASLERSRTLAPAFPLVTHMTSSRIPGIIANPSRPPRILRAQENNVKRSPSIASVTSTGAVVPVSDTISAVVNGSNFKSTRVLEENVTPRRYPTRSRTNMFSISGLPSKAINDEKRGRTLDANAGLNSKDAGAESAGTKLISALPSFVVEGSSNTQKDRGTSVPPSAALGKQKERRSPLREGRRFIPLVDSDDEEEEQNIFCLSRY